MELLIPERHRSDSKPFASLLINDVQRARASAMFVKCLKGSYEEDERRYGKAFKQRMMTDTEMRRRSEIMARWFRVLRGDLGYSLARCEAELPGALRAELDGVLYTPKANVGSFAVPQGDIQ